MKNEKPKFRIKKVEPVVGNPYYLCEERHWLWGWGDMFIVGGFEERWNQRFSSEEEAKCAIELESKKRKGNKIKIVWEGRYE